MPSNIQQFLKKIRHQLADFNLLNGIIRLLQYLLPALLLVILTETIFYLDPSGRTKLVVMVLAVSTSLLVFLITSWLINRNGYFGNSSDRDISRYAGEKLPGISDRLLNVYQLEKNLSAQQQGKDLADYAIRKMTAELGKVDPGQLKDPVKPSRWYMLAGVMAVTLITAGIFWHHFQPALIRLMHPNTEYPVPMPFTLISLTENQNVLGGDSLYVAFTGAGQLPDSLQVKWLVRGVERKSTVNLEDETYSFLFPGINADIVYWSEYESKSW
ncbi:MAG: hypothetical protein H8D46_03965, partial [FCB group bacterium]|nr:hypothetical protein [FCB group bacterium]